MEFEREGNKDYEEKRMMMMLVRMLVWEKQALRRSISLSHDAITNATQHQQDR